MAPPVSRASIAGVLKGGKKSLLVAMGLTGVLGAGPSTNIARVLLCAAIAAILALGKKKGRKGLGLPAKMAETLEVTDAAKPCDETVSTSASSADEAETLEVPNAAKTCDTTTKTTMDITTDDTVSNVGMKVSGKLQCPEEVGTLEVTDAAKSGDGTVANVGIKIAGKFQCPECRQKFDTEKASTLHWKFIHDPNRHIEN